MHFGRRFSWKSSTDSVWVLLSWHQEVGQLRSQQRSRSTNTAAVLLTGTWRSSWRRHRHPLHGAFMRVADHRNHDERVRLSWLSASPELLLIMRQEGNQNRLCGHGNLAAVLTTSGTAVANLLPAVVEAAQQSAAACSPPTVLLKREATAQIRLSHSPIFSVGSAHARDLPCPTTELPATFLLEEIDRAVPRGESHLDDSNAVTGGDTLRHSLCI